MKPIDVFIIGAQKAGTTSLLRYLSEHPQVYTHTQLEIPFFINDRLYRKGYSSAFKRYFPQYKEGQIVLGKNVGVFTNTQALQNLQAHNPQIKIILILRNPIDRAYSAYWYALQKGWETVLSFDEAVWLSSDRFKDPLSQRSCAYLERGLYAKWLREVYNYFPKENVWIYLFEYLRANTRGLCNDIYQRLILSTITHPDIAIVTAHNRAAHPKSFQLARLVSQPSQFKILKKLSRTSLPHTVRERIRGWITEKNRATFTYPPMKPETRGRLLEYYRPHNKELVKLLGIDLTHWNQ